jgi:esterase/lipase superfamily enzyme
MRTTVYFATNRVVQGPADAVASYRAAIVPPSDPTAMTYGVAFVENVDVARNAAGDVALIEAVSQGGFSAAVKDDLAHAGRNLLVFVHGFDNTFADALTRAAFNREWLAASGVAAADTTVLAFSWPSLGQLIAFPILQADYLRDQGMARQSGVHLMAFFAELEATLKAARANGFRTTLLAHSMGNLALQAAVESWFLHNQSGDLLFDGAVLAAGDCRYDSFALPDLHGLSGLGRLADRVSIYYSGADQVLQLSFVVNLGAFRLGQDGPRHRTDPTSFPPAKYLMEDCSALRDYDFGFMTSHQYYRQSPTARALIAARM